MLAYYHLFQPILFVQEQIPGLVWEQDLIEIHPLYIWRYFLVKEECKLKKI